MTNKPEKYPDWAMSNSYDPINKSFNVVEPTEQQKQIGFYACSQAANNHVNWLFRTINNWLKYLDERLNKPESYTVANAPSPAARGAGSMIYVTDENGGAIVAFSDGTNWRRVTDRAIIST